MDQQDASQRLRNAAMQGVPFDWQDALCLESLLSDEEKLVRDSFTMPEADFALVATLKERALKKGRAAKKSELLRAGLQLLGQQSPAALVAALERLQPIKTGRPKRSD